MCGQIQLQIKDFPDGGGGTNLFFGTIFSKKKAAWKWKNLNRGGASLAPLWIRWSLVLYLLND